MRTVSSWSAFLLLLAASALGGCASEVRCEGGAVCEGVGDDPLEGRGPSEDEEPSDDPTGGSSCWDECSDPAPGGEGGGGAGGGADLSGANALAILSSQIPPYDPGEDTGGTTTTTGGGPTSDLLFLEASSRTDLRCENPHDAYDCTPHWRVTFSMDPSVLEVGVHPIDGEQIWVSFSETGPEDEDFPGTCPGGGGGGFGGELEIIEIDQDFVKFRFALDAGFALWSEDPDPATIWIAPRCF